jgi:hypothetical protein
MSIFCLFICMSAPPLVSLCLVTVEEGLTSGRVMSVTPFFLKIVLVNLTSFHSNINKIVCIYKNPS